MMKASANLPRLQTSRLILRAMKQTDAEGYGELLSDETAYPYISDAGQVSAAQIPEKILRNNQLFEQGKAIYWALEYEGCFIGYVALHSPAKRSPALSYAVRRHWRRQGFAAEALAAICEYAFSTLGCQEIMARTHLGNSASEDLLVQLGFLKVGVVHSDAGDRTEFRRRRRPLTPRIYLHCLRHGITEGNLAGRYTGARDSLTAAQREQCRSVHFDSAQFDAVYCSPLGRCLETGDCLGLRSWTSEPRLAERSFGIFEGLTADECTERYPEAYAKFTRFDAEYQIPGGESRQQHYTRVESWLKALSGYQNVLAITHGGTIDFLYRIAAGLPLHGGKIHSGNNLAISTFILCWPQLEIVNFNIALADLPVDRSVRH
ncbi:MAG: GNAT family N-acetyltransferase [Cyanobacteria bacterium J06632_3]